MRHAEKDAWNDWLHSTAGYSDFATLIDTSSTTAFEAASSHPQSPSAAEETAFISGVNLSGIAGVSFWTWNQDDPPSYSSSSTAAKWGNSKPGTSGTITYTFDAASHWNSVEKHVFAECMSLWSAVANIKFVRGSQDANLVFDRGHDGSAFENSALSGSPKHANEKNLQTITHAQISIDTSVEGFGPINRDIQKAGGYVWMTVLHELGHALGLGHAGPYNEGTGDTDPYSVQFSAYDTRLWSIMSYINPSSAFSTRYHTDYAVHTDWGFKDENGYSFDKVPTTPMRLDIAAVQSLYGAPSATPFSGGQIFGFDCNIKGPTESFFDFSKNIHPVVTLWDQGENNTLDLSKYGDYFQTNVHLSPGTFSSCDGQKNNIAIASGTKIDNFVGSPGNDTVVCNNDGDTVKGGSSPNGDTIVAGGGRDIFIYGNYDSPEASFDTVKQFNFATDKFDVYSSIDVIGRTEHGSVSAEHFGSNFDLTVDNMQPHSAELFNVTGGDYKGDIFLIVNATSKFGNFYRELFIRLHGSSQVSHFGLHDFI